MKVNPIQSNGFRIIQKPKIWGFIFIALTVCCVIGFDTSKVTCSSPVDFVLSNHDPIILTGDNDVDQYFSGNGSDGLSWATAHVLRDLQINANQSGSCILLNHTTRYIRIENTSCTFSESWTTGPYAGIRLESCQNVNITKCMFWDCGYGLFIRNCTNIILEDVQVLYCRYGCQLQSVSNVVVHQLNMQENYLGLTLYWANQCTLTDLFVGAFQHGIALYYSHNNHFVNLQFSNPNYVGAENVLLVDSAGNDFGNYSGSITDRSFELGKYLPTIITITGIIAAIVLSWGCIIRRRNKTLGSTLAPQAQGKREESKTE